MGEICAIGGELFAKRFVSGKARRPRYISKIKTEKK